MPVVCDCFRHITEALLHLRKLNEGGQILLVELDTARKGLLCIGGLLDPQERLTLQGGEGGVIRIFINLPLNELKRVPPLSTFKKEVDHSLDCIEGILRTIHGPPREGLRFVPTAV